jgi:Zn-dependent protease with chaperone function
MSKKQNFPKQYRVHAIRSVFAIVFFIAVYLLILILSFALVALLFYSSILILRLAPGQRSILFFLFIFFVIDAIAITLLVFIFMFFFRKQTFDRSGWIEIDEDKQPKLFELIKSISKELDTNFPKKVYLGAGVDAMVFYDSNFRNLFIPSKENLMIGLGLVNSMTDCELKAIIAHEFGHFTQRSLNIYSYIYIENQIIYKMLIDEVFYQSLILEFSKIGKFSWVVIYYSRFIRWILRKAYKIVLKSAMALSREMEFHADAVSANLVGSVPAITALMRLSLASDSFNIVWQFYYKKISENFKTENIYPQHQFVIHKIAEKNELQLLNGYPQVKKEILSSFNRSKLVMENQWASHPSIIDRVNKLEDLNIYSDVSNDSAWNFFVNVEDLQKEITEKLFRNWQFADAPVNLSFEEFEINYLEELSKNLYDDRYSYFYEYRNISRFDLKPLLDNEDENLFKNFEEIYTKENLNLIYQFTGLTSDIRILDSISKGEFLIDVFEYDGSKYKSKESKELYNKLVKIHEEMYKRITELDIKIFKFFYSLAKASSREEKLVDKYEIYFYMVDEDKANLQVYLDLINAIQFIYRVHSFSQIEIKMTAMKKKENVFREQVKKLISDQNYHSLISDAQREKFQYYTNNNLIYFANQKYDQEKLKILEETIYQFYEICSRAPFYSLKLLLDFQMEILDS